ncbi:MULTISPECIES: hypothetical protein [unclassified Streptomyces]|uniref:hypothetical protein n=1 Tax=unclassified Streptomyces TaxID=2593676 RepID=UPI002E81CC91|nr:hypothetical protein [Streptomyces sp. NBC_00589]WTI42042.1 hypothetical protein OIC96_47340 [Streptomyces sp. NBC_00775]WUB24275.1 hypothetical protein OHA51_02380 [Streptomyces sp. NBC_00589]
MPLSGSAAAVTADPLLDVVAGGQKAPGVRPRVPVGSPRRAIFDALTTEQVRQFAEIGEAINAALQREDVARDDQEVLPWRRR